MHILFPFTQNVFAHSLSWVGGMLTVLGVGELVLGKKILLPPKWILRIGVAFLFIASCQAWFDEHRNVRKLIDEKSSLSSLVNQLQQQLAFKQTPIILETPPTTAQSNARSVASAKPNIQQKSEGNNSPNIVGDDNSVNINSAPRNLSATTSRAISSGISKLPPAEIGVVAYGSSDDAYRYAIQIAQALRAGGWKVEAPSTAVALKYDTWFGVVIIVGNRNNVPEKAKELFNILAGAKIGVKMREDREVPPDDFLLWIGTREN